jgi:cytoskeletal protein CcmA (bactofilin family)
MVIVAALCMGDSVFAQDVAFSSRITSVTLSVTGIGEAQGLTITGMTKTGSLSVTGTAEIATLNISSLSTAGTISVGGLTVTSQAKLGLLSVTGVIDGTALTISGMARMGALSVAGIIDAAGLTISGLARLGSLTVSGSIDVGSITATGNINSGSLTVAGGILAGSLTVTGNIHAANITVTGDMVTSDLTVTGFIHVNNLTSTGHIQANTITATGALNVSSLTVSGNIQARNLTATGNIHAANLTATNSIQTNNLTATGNINAASLTVTGRSSIGRILLSAGGSGPGLAPLKFTSGGPITPTEAGTVEYDGTVFYNTPSATPLLKGIMPSEHISWISGTDLAVGTSNAGAAFTPFASAHDVIVLAGSTSYLVEGQYIISLTSLQSASAMGFTVTGTALAGMDYVAITAVGATAAVSAAQYMVHANSNARTDIAPISTAGTERLVRFTGLVRTGAGTATLQPYFLFKTNAASVLVESGSFLKFTPIGTSTATGVGFQ